MIWAWIAGAAALVVVLLGMVLLGRRRGRAREEQWLADLVDKQHALRDKAHEALTAYQDILYRDVPYDAARSGQIDLAREHLLRVPDEADANAWALAARGASEQQVVTAWRVADEIRMYVTTAISPDPYC
jgi:hypothetical protein